MKAARYSFRDVKKLQLKQVFFDANILIYLFWPTGSYWEKSYSRIFKRLLQQKNHLVVDFLVLSEVVNRVIRIEYENYLRKNHLDRRDLKFKQFRDSIAGQDIIQDIYNIIKDHILSKFTILERGFSKADVISFLEVDSLDFSDKAILAICKENQYVLLTNDKDFVNINLNILTVNPVILQ